MYVGSTEHVASLVAQEPAPVSFRDESGCTRGFGGGLAWRFGNRGGWLVEYNTLVSSTKRHVTYVFI